MKCPRSSPPPHVLLDAPCTGTGTLRGNPEIRARLTREAVTELATLQRELLSTAAALTAPGGTLVYAVCALTREESLDNVKWFLEKYPDSTLEPLTTELPNFQTEYRHLCFTSRRLGRLFHRAVQAELMLLRLGLEDVLPAVFQRKRLFRIASKTSTFEFTLPFQGRCPKGRGVCF